jgi:predicted lipoprotein with Yx(FWY)xxD motif
MRKRGWAVTGLGTLVFVLAACGSSSTSPGSAYGTSSAAPMSPSSPAYGSGSPGTSGSAAGNGATLTIKKTSIGYVLANAKGYTLYWYARDHKNGASVCSAQCLAAWPALTGRPQAAMGVTLAGKLGTLARTGGVVQATYNGYPLYTYRDDMTPGETSGNGAGGVWHVITGSVLSTSAPSGSSGSSGSGYGSGYGSGSGY